MRSGTFVVGDRLMIHHSGTCCRKLSDQFESLCIKVAVSETRDPSEKNAEKGTA